MPGWNFADVWETVAQQVPDAPRSCTATGASRGPSSTAGPTASPSVLLDARRPGAGQGRAVPLQLHRVPRVDVRHVQGRPRAHQHELPLPRRRARVPVGQRRRRRGRLPRHVRRAHRGHQGPRPARRPRGCGSTTAPDRAPSGRPPTRTRRRRARPSRSAGPGAATATTCCCSTPAAPPACRRASCGARTTCSAPSSRRSSPARRRRPTRTSTSSAPRSPRPGPAGMPACPLMHGTGCFTQLIILSGGGCSVTLEARNLDIDELLDTIEREARQHDRHRRRRVRQADAARPRRVAGQVRHLEPLHGVVVGRDVQRGVQAGAAQAPPGDDARRRVLVVRGARHGPVRVVGRRARAPPPSSSSARTPSCITDDGRDVEPGSGETGRVAVGGFQPVGYYKDPEKTAATFLTIDGKRYSVPGDYATVEADGTLTLLGRGSVCINTGGEKVYPEEVEEVLKTHESVRDAVAVGVPDEKFGEAITAVVELASGAPLDEACDHRPREGQARGVQGAQARARRSTRSAAPRTARSTTSGSRPGRPNRSAPGSDATPEPAAGAAGRLPPRARRARPEGRAPVRARVRGRRRRQRGAARPPTATRSPRCGPARPRSTSSWSSSRATSSACCCSRPRWPASCATRSALIRIVPELERSGDLAEHIAKRAGTGLAAQLTPPARGLLERMGTVGRRRSGARPPTPSPTGTPPPPSGLEAGRRRARRPPHRASRTELLSGAVAAAWPPMPPSSPASTSGSATTPSHIGARVANAVG